MSKVSFAIDVDSLKVSQNGAITANIWLRIGAHEFPMRNWNDFAVVITEWWASALLRLLKKNSCQELIDFMDGSYAVEVIANSSENLVFRALQGINRDIEVAVSQEIAAMPFVHNFICQAQGLLDACRSRSYLTNDVEILQISLHALCTESIRTFNSRH